MKSLKKGDYVLSDIPNMYSKFHNKIGILVEDSFILYNSDISKVKFFTGKDFVPVDIPSRYLTKVNIEDYAELMI